MRYDAFINLLHNRAGKTGTPLSGTFELTPRCTLDCKMCYIHRRENDCAALAGEKSTEWWLSLAGKLRERGNLVMLLTGGEPMLRDDFDVIYTDCVKNGQLVSVNTNATLITDERKDMFRNLLPQRINVTLYGASEDTYEKLCGNGKMYPVVRNTIEELVKAGITVKLNFTMTPYNAGDLQAVYDFSKKLDIPLEATGYNFPPVRVEGTSDGGRRFSCAEAAERKLAWRTLVFGEQELRSRFDILRKGGILSADAMEDCADCGEKINCRAGSSAFWVTWDGKLTPCGMMNAPSAMLGDFDEAWAVIRAAREKMMLPAKCKACKLKSVCDVCAAVCYAENGRTDLVPEYMCSMTKEYAGLLNKKYGKE